MIKTLQDQHPRLWRLLEMIPGLLAWSLIIFPLWGSFVIPTAVAYFIIAFLLYWFYQSFKTAFLGIRGYFLIKKATKTNWQKKYQKEKKTNWLEWEKIKHVIIIPNYNESKKILEKTLASLIRQKDIDKKQLIVVLAMEERAQDAHQKAAYLLKKFRGKFGLLTAIFHPPDIEGEIKGKASNEAWAAKKIKERLIDKEGQDIKLFTVTSCDADARFHPRYFSALTYFFAKNPNRWLRFWQAPIFWYNNLNRVPPPIKIVGIIGNINHIANVQEPDKIFFNYSTYSLSFKLLDDIGYWDTDIIPEDWHLFLQAFFAKRGKVTVLPIFLPTSIDAPEGKTFWEALRNRYLQCQRHAWGATDIPYAIIQSFKHKDVPWGKKIFRIYKIIKTHLVWSTNWFILTLGASLPAFLNPKFFQTAMGYNLPRFSRTVLTICLLALFVIITLDMRLRPKEMKKYGFKGVVGELIQWVLMPVSTLFMAVLPGLDAHTRLMLGKRIEYKVTKKYDR
ncbi:glycosyltransferase family 2 protein [bacterium]|nr:glycosyltransferase family 2 protein [bacterium]